MMGSIIKFKHTSIASLRGWWESIKLKLYQGGYFSIEIQIIASGNCYNECQYLRGNSMMTKLQSLWVYVVVSVASVYCPSNLDPLRLDHLRLVPCHYSQCCSLLSEPPASPLFLSVAALLRAVSIR